jgi:hypothetical protein
MFVALKRPLTNPAAAPHLQSPNDSRKYLLWITGIRRRRSVELNPTRPAQKKEPGTMKEESRKKISPLSGHAITSSPNSFGPDQLSFAPKP